MDKTTTGICMNYEYTHDPYSSDIDNCNPKGHCFLTCLMMSIFDREAEQDIYETFRDAEDNAEWIRVRDLNGK